MIFSLLAAAFTFTATATGVQKGTPLEFLFAASDTDRDYETMFLIKQPIADFCRDIEKAGLHRGSPIDVSKCHLWPVGCTVKMTPSISDFVESKMPSGLSSGTFVYTGGTRDEKGVPIANGEMPASLFSLYTLPQSPFLPKGIHEQGQVYGCHTAAQTLKKGAEYRFTISWDGETAPNTLKIVARSGNGADIVRQIRTVAETSDLDVEVVFDGSMNVAEARKLAAALALIDSDHVMINGCGDGLFFRAFLPLEKWLDRRERLTQPFELTIGNPDKLVYIDEDWSVDGDDPKLTERTINHSSVSKYPKTDTCFIFAKDTTTLGRIYESVAKLKGGPILNWYVYGSHNESSHNAPCTKGVSK